MKVGLLDIDSKYQNSAMMKISHWHKSQGDTVEWYLEMGEYDVVYMSKIFDFSPMPQYPIKNLISGGTGYDYKIKLPPEIEASDYDYSIYPAHKYSIAYYSKGCVRSCGFCIVPKSEGDILSVKPKNLNPNGTWLYVMDNNFFSNPEWKSAVKHIKSTKLPVRFDGIDIRLLTEEMAYELNSIKLKGYVHIAWDYPKDRVDLEIERVLSYGTVKAYKFLCYVLVGNKTTEDDDMYRIERLRELGVDPYVMPMNKKDPYQKRVARWVNHKAIFKSVKWKDYNG